MRKFIFYIVITLLFCNVGYSQTKVDTLKVKTLDEVVVVAGTNYQVRQVYIEPKIYERSIQLQQTSPGQLSPFLGGFTGNQVDQVINDIRFNSALFRTGPNQYFGWVPMNFTKRIRISDGGNIGGTINRELGIDSSSIKLSYDGGVNGTTNYISYKEGKFGIAVNSIINDNVRSVGGEIPHSSYNQNSLITEYQWSNKNKTTFLFTQSNDLERTDKWNGGERINGFQDPKIYTWELQRYILLNHKYDYKDLKVNFAYQNFSENILNKTTRIKSRLNSFTINGEYMVSDNLELYTSNVIEHIDYQTEGVDYVPNDLYKTLKQGLRWDIKLKGFNVFVSGGYKTVKITDIEPFSGFESSLIIGKKGFFGSYVRSLNAPSYLMVKQSITTGKAEQLPNPDLKQENSDSYRVGYKNRGFYVDFNYRLLNDAISTIFINSDTIQTVNQGKIKVWSSNVGFNKDNLLNKGISLKSRLEYVYGKTSTDEPINKVSPFRTYVKISKDNLWVDWSFQIKDDELSENDLNDVRQYAHNKGVNIISVGYDHTLFKHKNNPINLGVSVYNILNNESRITGSSTDLPKRSVLFNLKMNL